MQIYLVLPVTAIIKLLVVKQAHVCVEQTAMDLISNGITVHIVADATTSRTQEDRLLALEVSYGSIKLTISDY